MATQSPEVYMPIKFMDDAGCDRALTDFVLGAAWQRDNAPFYQAMAKVPAICFPPPHEGPGTIAFLANASHITSFIKQEMDYWIQGKLGGSDISASLGSNPTRFFSFEFWLRHAFDPEHLPVGQDRIRAEDMLAGVTLNSLLEGMTQQTNPHAIACYLVAVSDVSNNWLGTSSAMADAKKIANIARHNKADLLDKHLQMINRDDPIAHLRKLTENEISALIPSKIHFEYRWTFPHEQRDQFETYWWSIIREHLWILAIGAEKGKPCDPNMIAAFFDVIREGTTHWQEPDRLECRFTRAYLDGIAAVVRKTIDGKHNGSAYLTDRLESLCDTKSNGIASKDEWRQRLFEGYKKYEEMFDFLHPLSLVREFANRYADDDQAIADLLHDERIDDVDLISIGAGNLLVADYQLTRQLLARGFNVSYVPVDKLPLKELAYVAPDISVVKFGRKHGDIATRWTTLPPWEEIPKRRRKLPITEKWSLAQKSRLLAWRQQQVRNAIYFDILQGTPPVDRKGNLVEVRGLLAIFPDLDRRVSVLEHSLACLEDGGILSISGASAFSAQNAIGLVAYYKGGQLIPRFLRIGGRIGDNGEAITNETVIEIPKSAYYFDKIFDHRWKTVSLESEQLLKTLITAVSRTRVTFDRPSREALRTTVEKQRDESKRMFSRLLKNATLFRY